MQENGPSRLNDFLISGVIAFFLSPIVIIIISISDGYWPDGYNAGPFGGAFLFAWIFFAIICTIIFFIISLVIRAVQGPKNHSTTNTYNPPNYQNSYQQPQHSLTSVEALNSLEKLAELKDKGIISDKEFQKEKDKILNQ